MPDNSKALIFPQWNSDNPGESLNLIYQWAVQTAQERIDWYIYRKEIKKRWCQWLRALSIIFAAAGAICPLVKATEIFDDKWLPGQWGYVFLAVAAAFVSYDRFFGLSSGWMRYMLTQLSLEKTLKGFQYDWLMMTADQQPGDNSLKLLGLAKDFSLQLDTTVQKETDMWVAEFSSSIAELETRLKADEETKTAGAVQVKGDKAW